MDNKPKPFWIPDTQGFLALAIIGLIGTIVVVLMAKPITLDDKVSGMLTMLIGVLTACLKDVYSYFFGSSKGSTSKDDTINKIAAGITEPAKPMVFDDSHTMLKSLAFVAVLMLGALFSMGASAQGLKVDPVARLKADLGIQSAPNRTGTLTGSPINDLIGALDDKLLPDLNYALKLATASNSKVTAPCWQAWIDIISVRQKAVRDEQGQSISLPDPHIVTDFEKLVELRNALQPDSEFMLKCSPVASMIKKDILGFMATVVSGGAGLAALGIGL